MVATRGQERAEKRKHDGKENKQEEEEPSESSPSKKVKHENDTKADESKSNNEQHHAITAKCKDNQALVDELYRLSGAMFRAQNVDTKNRYKGSAIGKAARALAQLNFKITSGHDLAEGNSKVPGVGKGTANYIDEFLAAGELYEIHEYDQMAKEAHQHHDEEQKEKKKEDDYKDVDKKKKSDNDNNEKKNESDDDIQINRAPVLTLWAVVVAERQGFTHAEALTYGKFVSAMFARSKGKALGLFHDKPKTEQEKQEQKKRDEELGVDHVQGFGKMLIPVLSKDGQRLAVIQGETQDPAHVQDYLERSFGDKLDATQIAMKQLAESMSVEELKPKAYKMYEKFRPAWKGWGKKSILHLSDFRNMVSGNGSQ